MRILFFGESWQGSTARSMKEALSRQPGVELAEVNEDAWMPRVQGKFLRAVHRTLRPLYRREMLSQLRRQVSYFRPEVFVAYKGHPLTRDLIAELNSAGITTLNIYPDYSPLAFGPDHRRAVGEYQLVVSTKPFHPQLWHGEYGYANTCVFVPHGYDPNVHLNDEEPQQADWDVTLVATYRPEYADLLFALAETLERLQARVCIGGPGWTEYRSRYPSNWNFAGPVTGRAYVNMLRQARICLSPVMRHIVVDGKRQPGDEDSTRTYELSAANCFYIHQRTDYVTTIFDEAKEVPMFSSSEELAHLIKLHLANESGRRTFARAAHRRAVPAYSLDARAAQIASLIG